MATGAIKAFPIVVDTASKDNIDIQASSASTITFSCAKSGYTALGIVGYAIANGTSSGSGASNVVQRGCFLSDSTTVTVYARNTSSSDVRIKVTAYILYQRN